MGTVISAMTWRRKRDTKGEDYIELRLFTTPPKVEKFYRRNVDELLAALQQTMIRWVREV